MYVCVVMCVVCSGVCVRCVVVCVLCVVCVVWCVLCVLRCGVCCGVCVWMKGNRNEMRSGEERRGNSWMHRAMKPANDGISMHK